MEISVRYLYLEFVLFATICGTVQGIPEASGSVESSSNSGGNSSNDNALQIAGLLSNIYDLLGEKAEGLLECEFPFIYKNVQYHHCTTDHDYYGMFWCSTRTNEKHQHVYNAWRHCRLSDGVPMADVSLADEESSDMFCHPPDFVIPAGTQYGCPCSYHSAVQTKVGIGRQCCQPSVCPNANFNARHVCGSCRNAEDILEFARKSLADDPAFAEHPYVFPCLGLSYELVRDTCVMKEFVQTWGCYIEAGSVTNCEDIDLCGINTSATNGSIIGSIHCLDANNHPTSLPKMF